MKILNNTALGQVVDLRLFAFCIMVLLTPLSFAQEVYLTQLEKGGIDRWETKSFKGVTHYNVGEFHQNLSLQAISNGSASGLVLKQEIDLTETPFLNWQWLIENRLQGLDERIKVGDDFAARIYVVIDGGWRFWNTLSLNYVWSSNQEQGLVWNNPFAGENVKMMSVRGAKSAVGRWQREKQNVYQDLIATFGDKGSEASNQEAYGKIDAIAIMTDTDNSEKDAVAYYGDLFFSAQ